MRRVCLGGGLGVIAFLTGWLLFTDTATAKPTTALPFTVSPKSGNFGETILGGTSGVTFTFRSTTTETLSFSQFATAAPFYFSGNKACPRALNYQDTCTKPVFFSPTKTGQVRGSLTFVYQEGSQAPVTASIPLSGVGVTELPGLPHIQHRFLRGARIGKPVFGFTLLKGKDAPKIKGFTLVMPRGLGFRYEPATDWGRQQWRCGLEGGRTLRCKTTTPVKEVRTHFAYPALDESKKFMDEALKLRRFPDFRLRVLDAHNHSSAVITSLP